jgi:hypothetical protein
MHRQMLPGNATFLHLGIELAAPSAAHVTPMQVRLLVA